MFFIGLLFQPCVINLKNCKALKIDLKNGKDLILMFVFRTLIVDNEYFGIRTCFAKSIGKKPFLSVGNEIIPKRIIISFYLCYPAEIKV